MAKIIEKKAKKPVNRFIGSNVPTEIYEALCAQADAADRSLSKQVLFILKESLAVHDQQ